MENFPNPVCRLELKRSLLKLLLKVRFLPQNVRSYQPSVLTAQEVVAKTGGWDYAKTFQSKFHSGEMNSDIVRRRRWRRMMNSRNVGPVCFEVGNRVKLKFSVVGK